MIKTNLEKLVDLAVSGNAGHPAVCDSGAKTAYDGSSFVPIGFSGINFMLERAALNEQMERVAREVIPHLGAP